MENIEKPIEKANDDVKIAGAIIVVWLIVSLAVIVAAPFVNSLFNNPEKIKQAINQTVIEKGQILYSAEQESNLEWTAISYDDINTYWNTFTSDGKKIIFSRSKRTGIKPYLNLGVSSTNEKEASYPVATVKKQKNITIEFFYDPHDGNGYVNSAIVSLLRDALPSADISEYCYGDLCPNQNLTKGTIEVKFKNLNSSINLPAIIINGNMLVPYLIGIGETDVKLRYISNLKYFCQFIDGEPACEN